MNRRNFINTSCLACAGIITTAVILPSCGSALPLSKATLTENKLVASLLPMGTSNIMIVRNMNLDADILVVKNNSGGYKSLRMMCTHESQPLTATATGLVCPSHGSQFNLDGDVVREPATKKLTEYRCEVLNESITIYLK